jgi:DNA ligase-1
MITHRTIFKFDTTKRLRVWYMEVEGDSYRTVSGLQDGQKVTTEWTIALPKNVGKANATTAEEQAISEVEAQYKKQLAQGGYHETIEAAKNGATFFEPMLAKKYEDFLKKPSWPVYTQPKLDGVRCIVNINGMWSREGKPIIACPHIFEALKPFLEERPSLVFDGELYNHDLKDDFNKIISCVRKQKPTQEDIDEAAKLVQYHVYDLFDENHPEWNFDERYLSENVYYDDKVITHVITSNCKDQEDLDRLYAEFMSEGYEGQMIRINAPYENKRSKYLLKRKEFMDEEFEVVSINEGIGNWSGCAKSIRLRKKDRTEFDSGVRGTQEYCRELLGKTFKYATCRFQNYTPDGIPRFPVVTAFYEKERDL